VKSFKFVEVADLYKRKKMSTPITIPGMSFHWKIKIGIWIWLIPQCKMPPLFSGIIKTVLIHQCLEQEAVNALLKPDFLISRL